MEPRIETLPLTKLIGMHLRMSWPENRTAQLFRSFMPRRAEITNRLNRSVLSMHVFDRFTTQSLTSAEPFEKWAAVAVNSFDDVPQGMDTHVIRGGQYAVFMHEGPSSAFLQTARFIFDDWLPRSGRAIDNREQFEVLEEGYRLDATDAREEVWIPIR